MRRALRRSRKRLGAHTDGCEWSTAWNNFWRTQPCPQTPKVKREPSLRTREKRVINRNEEKRTPLNYPKNARSTEQDSHAGKQIALLASCALNSTTSSKQWYSSNFTKHGRRLWFSVRIFPTCELQARKELLKLGSSSDDIEELTDEIKKKQSQEAGVSIAYFRSEDFLREVETRCKPKDPQNFDPSFYELKEAFFYDKKDKAPEDPWPLGKDLLCPRDNRYGCALVDTLPPLYRQQATHYLSWTWKYKLSLVQDALQVFLLEMNAKPSAVFLYMCFFVNNQYRILFEKDGVGSSNLENVFENTLSRIGHMVAILDDWHSPVYLTRIWTIFEQFTAIKLGHVKVTMVLPQAQNQSLVEQMREGEEGIRHITQCLCKFQSKNATAFSPEDEENVKKLITSTIGFPEVDRKIEQFMLDWVGTVMEEQLRSEIQETNIRMCWCWSLIVR